MKMLKNQKGFTLIELVLVIVVLGVLAAVATVQFGNLSRDAKDAALQGGFASASTQLAVAISTVKALPTASAAGANSFGVEVYNRLAYSTGLSKSGIACAGTDCTFDVRTNACVAGTDRRITATYNGPTHATTPGLISITTGPVDC
jgi:MSHA pilin protein MshA